MSGGKGNTRGTPQGGVASPLLANIYMNRFLKHWRLTGCGDTFYAHVVSYADDFVIRSRGRAEALVWTKAVMTKLGLTTNEAKTSLRNARKERFDFLGYSFGAHRFEANGNWSLGASPSKKSVQRARRARHTVASTNTSLNVCAGSSREGTRCKGAAIADSHSMSFIEKSAFCASNACPERSRRVPCGEAGRKAGCRKSTRPV
jgi:hypothetical protein